MIKGRELFEYLFGKAHYVDKLIHVIDMHGKFIYRVFPIESVTIQMNLKYSDKDKESIEKSPVLLNRLSLTSNEFYCKEKLPKVDLHETYYNTDTMYLYERLIDRFNLFNLESTGYSDLTDLLKEHNFVIINSFLKHNDPMYYAEINSIITNNDYKYSKED